MNSPTPFLLAVMGPTASGKSELAEALAARVGAMLLNADAFQVYRGMDIGTAKPENRENYRLLDLVDPQDAFSVGSWLSAAHNELARLFAESRSAIVVGGTGLYLRALFEAYSEMSGPAPEGLREALIEREQTEGLASLVSELRSRDPEVANSIDIANPVRVRRALEKLDSPDVLSPALPAFRKAKVGIIPEQAETDKRIERRVDSMLERGWLDEVRGLLEQGVTVWAPGMRAIGYRDLAAVATGKIALEVARTNIITATKQYAKRQRTWFRAEPNLNVLNNSEDLEQQAIKVIEASSP